MADRQVVRTRRRVIATIVVLETLLVLCRWLLPRNHPDSVYERYDFVLLDMLIVVGLVLLATRALRSSDDEDASGSDIDASSVRGLLSSWAVPVGIALSSLGMMIGTVMGGWLIGLYMVGVMAGIMGFATLFGLMVVFALSPTGQRFGAAVEKGFAAIGRTTPVRKFVSYFAAEDVVGD